MTERRMWMPDDDGRERRFLVDILIQDERAHPWDEATLERKSFSSIERAKTFAKNGLTRCVKTHHGYCYAEVFDQKEGKNVMSMEG